MSDSTNDERERRHGDDSRQGGWWRRLTGGLKRTSSSLGTAIADLVTKGPLDPAKLDEIEEALIRADLGSIWPHRVAEAIGQGRLQPGRSRPTR